ncbi:MAG: calcium-binding protein, partial [Desulfobacteraceae bacterium]|nr:calcium-binding protein [Desulfobacteraceae bacterium]
MSSKLTVITLAALLMFPLSAAAAGFTINPTGGLTTTEDGGTATFTVNLTTQPVGNVTIGVSSSDTTEGTVSPSELTFTSANYSTPQTVTVTGFDDNIIDGDRPYTVVLEVAASTDPDYNLLDPPDVSVTSTDTDTAGFSITPATGLTTEEDGTQATFTVRLVSRPTADVTISISSSDTSEGTVLPTTLTFTPANWNGVQTVTVTGVDDSSVDGDQDYSIVMGAASSSDANYNGIDPGDVSVTNVDNNSAGFTVTPVTGLVTTELGGTATFTVKLNGQPAENVTFDINSSDEAEGTVSPSSLTFTSLNWNAEQTVTVTGVADGLVDGDQSYTVILDTAYSSDPNYDGLDPDDVSLTNTDTDSPGFYIVQVGPMDPVTGYLMTTEDGDYATFTVNLTSKPTNRVYIDVDSGTYSEGMVMPGTGCTLLFTPTNWKVPQTVTVMGTDDFMNPVTDGNQIYIVDLFPDTASLDPLYDDNDPGEITMINIDNETAGFQTGVVSGNTTEAGGTATFTVELISQPQNNVTIVVTTLDNTEGSALPTSLTFTTADWDTNQTVTVTGVNDSIADGDQSFYVRLDPSLSADTVYKGLSPQNVS